MYPQQYGIQLCTCQFYAHPHQRTNQCLEMYVISTGMQNTAGPFWHDQILQSIINLRMPDAHYESHEPYINEPPFEEHLEPIETPSMRSNSTDGYVDFPTMESSIQEDEESPVTRMRHTVNQLKIENKALEQELAHVKELLKQKDALLKTRNPSSCPVCFLQFNKDDCKEATVVPCGHVICFECGRKVKSCPTCRSKPVKVIRIFRS
ncbi:hypothetical protein L3Y34_002074 [Caenorhabditis briggsae]|uniref:RING-type domain-containing protein n=2 Tax=Caenorhabditis briggsae TaxID=6238 RepID=A0AAE9DE00_CAEBR|nr:hypothetical protein L3Y34_002074 [Caenorhabditis briggsae]